MICHRRLFLFHVDNMLLVGLFVDLDALIVPELIVIIHYQLRTYTESLEKTEQQEEKFKKTKEVARDVSASRSRCVSAGAVPS